jgi:hypothetical protein
VNFSYKASPWGMKFHALTVDEALAGGSAGPGKTEILIHEADRQIAIEHQRCTDPNHPFPIAPGESKGWALFLRRTRTNLEQTIVRALQVFKKMDPKFKWDSQKSIGEFYSGFRFQFGHCQNRNDWMNYQGREITRLMFDELTEFLEDQYTPLTTWVRTPDPVLCKMLGTRAASNPVLQRASGDSFAVDDPTWVRRYFVDPAPEGGKILRRAITLDNGEHLGYATRIFMPATIDDNPDPAFVVQYKRKLASLPEHLRRALLYGDWYVTVGSYFGDVWNPRLHVCEPFKVPRIWKFFRTMDWGFKAPGTIIWFAMNEEGNLFAIKELTFRGKYPDEVCKLVCEIETGLGLWTNRSLISGPADTQLWEMRGHGQRMSMAEEFARAGVSWIPAEKTSDTSVRWISAQRVSQRLADHHSGTTTPGLVFFNTCKNSIRTLPSIQAEAGDPEMPQDGGEDHWFDAIRYACTFASRGRKALGMAPIDREDLERRALKKETGYDRGRDGYGSRA